MKEIICGFAGIGKSYVAKGKKGFVDLESTPFQKNWDLYADVAVHMAKNGYRVMVSCHKELRGKLKEKGADYRVYVPLKIEKYSYLQRYKDRGDDEQFLKLFEDNFEKFIDEIEESEDNIFWLHNKFLYDVFIRENL